MRTVKSSNLITFIIKQQKFLWIRPEFPTRNQRWSRIFESEDQIILTLSCCREKWQNKGCLTSAASSLLLLHRNNCIFYAADYYSNPENLYFKFQQRPWSFLLHHKLHVRMDLCVKRCTGTLPIFQSVQRCRVLTWIFQSIWGVIWHWRKHRLTGGRGRFHTTEMFVLSVWSHVAFKKKEMNTSFLLRTESCELKSQGWACDKDVLHSWKEKMWWNCVFFSQTGR